jgi:exosortase A-associated hydrolase 2
VLFVHAFAEEMHKSRRMAALQSRALSARGFDVLQVDLLGCGDSSGDFSDAGWDDWLEDVRLGTRALAARSGAPLWLWGHRTGCLLACAHASACGRPAQLLLWQPVTAGAHFLNQFLRMRVMAQNSKAGREARADTRMLREQLVSGRSVEVAGYVLSPRLAAGLDRAELAAPPPGSRVCWIDVVHAPNVPAPDVSCRLTHAWSQAGITVAHHTVPGLPFWQTQEISECEPLIAQSLQSLCP